MKNLILILLVSTCRSQECEPTFPQPPYTNAWLYAPNCTWICDKDLLNCLMPYRPNLKICQCQTTTCDSNLPPCANNDPRNPDTCDCPIAVCSMPYGCADMSETPPCICKKCLDLPCDDNSTRLLEYNCQCIDPSSTLSSSTSLPPCDPPFPPPPNKIWIGQPFCEFVCDPQLPQCQNPLHERDPESCECSCEPLNCSHYEYPNLDICECSLVEMLSFECPDLMYRNTDRFVCECRPDLLEWCPNGQSRDPNTCECLCEPIIPPPLYTNSWLYTPNCTWICEPTFPALPYTNSWLNSPNCTWICDAQILNCQDPMIPNFDICECQRYDCDPPWSSPECMEWLGAPNCTFIPIPSCTITDSTQSPSDIESSLPPCDPPFPPPPNKIWIGQPFCEFVCDPELPECPNGQPRDPDTCECMMYVCDPIWPPPYPANQWLPYPDCKWICDLNSLGCTDNLIPSNETCSCICPLDCITECPNILM